MNENYVDPDDFLYEEDDEESHIDIMPYVRKLLQNWKRIMCWAGVAAVIGLVVGFSKPKSYTVSTVLAPEITQKSGGNLSSLAAIAGINLTNTVMTDAMYPDLYPQIVESVPFLAELSTMPVTFVRNKEVLETDLYTYLSEHGKAPWWSHVINAPFRGLAWVIEKVKPVEDTTDNDSIAAIDPAHLSKKQSRVLGALGHSIGVSVEKKTFLITITVRMQDAVVAKDVCDQVVNSLQAYVTQYRTEKARKDLVYYQKLDDEARENYFQAQQKYAQYADAYQGLTRNTDRIDQLRLQNEMTLAFNIYSQTQQQVQVAKAKVQHETPVCVVLKPATVPLRGAPSKGKILIIFTFLGGMIACAWILFGEMIIALWKSLWTKDEDNANPAGNQ